MTVYTTLGTDDENLKITVTDDITADLTVIALPVTVSGGSGAVDSVNGQTGVVVLDIPDAVSDLTNDSGYITDYTVTEGDVTAHQAALSITESQITDLDHFSGDYDDLTNKPTIPTNNNQLANGAGYITDYTVTETDVTDHEAALTITESQISDLGAYITDYTVTESDVTAHQAALSITESQISDLQSYITDYTVTEDDVTAHEAALTITQSQISDLVHYTDSDADARIAAADLQDLNNVNASLNPSDGQVLAWDNANSYWTNADPASGSLDQTTTPTLTFDETSAMPEGYVTGQITNYSSYTSPAVELIVDSTTYSSQSVSIPELNANSYSINATNGKFCIRMLNSSGTQTIKIRVQDFGESPSTQVTQAITVTTPVVSSGSYRYYRFTMSSVSNLSNNNIERNTGTTAYMYIEEWNLFTGAGATGTQYPSTMTANTTGSEVASAQHEYSTGFAAWKAFDRNSNTGLWTLSQSDPLSDQFLKIDLGTARTIESFKLEANSTYRPLDILIEGSNDDSTYTTIVDITGLAAASVENAGGMTIG